MAYYNVICTTDGTLAIDFISDIAFSSSYAIRINGKRITPPEKGKSEIHLVKATLETLPVFGGTSVVRKNDISHVTVCYAKVAVWNFETPHDRISENLSNAKLIGAAGNIAHLDHLFKNRDFHGLMNLYTGAWIKEGEARSILLLGR